MGKLFLPACKVKAKYKYASEQLRRYLEEREQVKTIGCCKVFCREVGEQDSAIVLCNNCAAILEESSRANQIQFVWNIIDKDPAFPFPDYHGARMTVQDCWRAREKRAVQDAVRSLLSKMNIQVVELEENYERTRFCGADLLNPCTEIEKKFAPQRYAVSGAGMYQSLSPVEQENYLQEHCKKIETEQVVCYCMSCLNGINQGGKQAVHLLTLLFPEGN